MAAGETGLMGALKLRMHWHQSRQKLLAENVANADTPGFKPADFKAPAIAARQGFAVAPVRTASMHLALGDADGSFDRLKTKRFETTPSGNSVNLEDEMMKSAQNQSDYQLAATLYSKSLGLMKIAIGKGR